MWLDLILIYGIKVVNILVVSASVFGKFVILNYPPLIKAFSASWVQGLQTFWYLFAWDEFFFPLVIVSCLYDSWLIIWHLDYSTLLASYKAALNLEVPPMSADIPPSIPEGLKSRMSEEAATTSLNKTVFYGGAIGVIYIALIVVGIAVGAC